MVKGRYFGVPGLLEADSRLLCNTSTTEISGFETEIQKILDCHKY